MDSMTTYQIETRVQQKWPAFLKLELPQEGFQLERGGCLREIHVAFECYGKLNDVRDNVILVCHALTGSSHAADLPNTAYLNFPHLSLNSGPPGEEHLLHRIERYPGWWDGAIGPGKALDTDRFCILVPNILGSCYGTTGPMSKPPGQHAPYNTSFPDVTIRDMVAVQALWIQQLGIKRLHAVVGGSLGGMQVLEWALMFPEIVQRIIPIATTAAHSPWAIAFNEIARLAIMNDPAWQEGHYTSQPKKGMALARMAAMISYRSFASFHQKFGRQKRFEVDKQNAFSRSPVFQIESYLHYQGEKFLNRFDANSYIILTRAMDWHDVAAGRGELTEVLRSIHHPALVIGIDSDVLYPVEEQKFLANHLPDARYAEIVSPHGHDAFLIEWKQLTQMIKKFVENSAF